MILKEILAKITQRYRVLHPKNDAKMQLGPKLRCNGVGTTSRIDGSKS
jgi:hypothetical protein